MTLSYPAQSPGFDSRHQEKHNTTPQNPRYSEEIKLFLAAVSG
jgi:hypothetical protein